MSLNTLITSYIDSYFIYSTVAEWVKKDDFREISNKIHRYNSIILKFTLSFYTPKLTKTSHYTPYQQKLYDEVKRLKEVEGLGYRRISYLIYEKGYRGIRSNSVLRNNDIYSIYKKGKIREERINREFKNVVSDIVVYEY